MLTIENLRNAAAALAVELAGVAADTPEENLTGTGGGSRHRAIPDPLRLRLIGVRAELVQRGVFDPTLARFDTATVTQSSLRELAEELAKIAESLR